MRVAVLYSGFLRSWETCRPNQERTLGLDKCDLYFFSPEEPYNTRYKQFVRDHVVTRYYPFLNDYDANKNPVTQLHGSLNQWYCNFLGFGLVPTDYDCYVRSRSDIEVSDIIDFSQYEMKNDTVYIPSGNDHCGGTNDHLAFGNYQSMQKYFSIFTEHRKIFESGVQFHTEAYVTANLKAQGVEIVRIEPTTIIIRQDNPTVFSAKTKWIRSENAGDHWSMLTIQGKRILDLGAGRMWELRPTTPEYFLNQGAKEVIGVECSPSEEPWYKENVPDKRLRIITDKIESVAHLRAYFKILRPEIVKCDIEGQEIHLQHLSAEDMDSVEEIAIEYHGKECLHSIEHSYQMWGFQEIQYYKLQNFDTDEQGVIHLKK